MTEQKDYTQHLQYNFFWVQHKVMVQLTCKIKQMKIEKIASTFFPLFFKRSIICQAMDNNKALVQIFLGSAILNKIS